MFASSRMVGRDGGGDGRLKEACPVEAGAVDLLMVGRIRSKVCEASRQSAVYEQHRKTWGLGLLDGHYVRLERSCSSYVCQITRGT